MKAACYTKRRPHSVWRPERPIPLRRAQAGGMQTDHQSHHRAQLLRMNLPSSALPAVPKTTLTTGGNDHQSLSPGALQESWCTW